MATLRPRALRIRPIAAAVTPLPTELTTPPVQKIYRVMPPPFLIVPQQKERRRLHHRRDVISAVKVLEFWTRSFIRVFPNHPLHVSYPKISGRVWRLAVPARLKRRLLLQKAATRSHCCRAHTLDPAAHVQVPP